MTESDEISLQCFAVVHNLALRVPIISGPYSAANGPSALQEISERDVRVYVTFNGLRDESELDVDLLVDALRDAVKTKQAFYPSNLIRALSNACLPFRKTVDQLVIKIDFPGMAVMSNSATLSLLSSRFGEEEIRFELAETRLGPSFVNNGVAREKPVLIDVACAYKESTASSVDFPSLERVVAEFVYSTDHRSLETMLTNLCAKLIIWLSDHSVEVSAKCKEFTVSPLEASAVTVTRKWSDLSKSEIASFGGGNVHSITSAVHGRTIACLAIGSNLGDRFQNIELGLRYLDAYVMAFPSSEYLGNITGDLCVINTSFLYETAPMYVTDQPFFINCACLVETSMTALDLLRVAKQIEKIVGRVPSIRNGPRALDIDIVTFGSQTLDTRPELERRNLDNLEGQLVVPHPRMAEREFVLRPLNDIIPDWVHPQFHMTIRAMLKSVLLVKSADEPPMHKVVPFASPANNPSTSKNVEQITAPPTQTYWTLSNTHEASPQTTRRTFIMATLNVTPDSFSDGSEHYKMEDALTYVSKSISSGADIIDIGGYSTRPGAAFVTTEDEINRVVPVIRAIRESNLTKGVLISVDTFRYEVAKAAVEAGANCINDVYAFSGTGYPYAAENEAHFEKMRSLARGLAVPVVLMHSRGDAGSNKDYSAYSSRGLSLAVVDGVRIELGRKVDLAIRGKGGIRRWNVIIDPGIGFSKTVEDNLQLLRRSSEVTADAIVEVPSDSGASSLRGRNKLTGFPVLIGTSRKSFLGAIIARPLPPANSAERPSRNPKDRPAKERDFATAAAVACAVQQGATVIRVHEVQGMADVVKVASALW